MNRIPDRLWLARRAPWVLVTLGILFAGAATHAVAKESPATSDATLFALFDQLNNQDIEMARLALSRSKDTQVQSLAKMIIADHGNFGPKARALAMKAKLPLNSPNPELSLAHDRRMVALRAASPSQFDRVYLTHELDFANNFVKTLNERIYPGMQQPELKQFLKGLGPALSEHLEHIKHVAHMTGTP